MAKRAVTNQRQMKEIVAQNTKLKREVNSLRHRLKKWWEWYTPIFKAVDKGDNLRAIALLEEGSPHGQVKNETGK